MRMHSVEESLAAWEANAAFWDANMGENSNEFHRTVVRPRVTQLLQARSGDLILDIACGNGNYSAFLAEQGAEVVAFDYSPNMISLARKRQEKNCDRIHFCVADATKPDQLLSLQKERPYDKAVCNMAIMDLSRADVLFSCVRQLLVQGGSFVFATQHPCFVTLSPGKYVTSHSYLGEAIAGQPVLQCYYHRSLQELFALCLDHGFIIDGFYEECYRDPEKPEIVIVRARKEN